MWGPDFCSVLHISPPIALASFSPQTELLSPWDLIPATDAGNQSQPIVQPAAVIHMSDADHFLASSALAAVRKLVAASGSRYQVFTKLPAASSVFFRDRCGPQRGMAMLHQVGLRD